MPFCTLQPDIKTFEYFKKYVEFLEKEGKSCHILDNQIQAFEMKDHLVRNGYTTTDYNEIENWIQKNARPFRDYLNTIKLVYIVWKCMGKHWQEIEFEDFSRIQERLNGLKDTCLDTIF
jgi:hypothetical protein